MLLVNDDDDDVGFSLVFLYNSAMFCIKKYLKKTFVYILFFILFLICVCVCVRVGVCMIN